MWELHFNERYSPTGGGVGVLNILRTYASINRNLNNKENQNSSVWV